MPIHKLRTITIPKWTGSIPNAVTTGRKIGVNINTVPVLDLRIKGASGIIGDRSFSKNKKTISSTLIRKKISVGKIENANKLLDHPFFKK